MSIKIVFIVFIIIIATTIIKSDSEMFTRGVQKKRKVFYSKPMFCKMNFKDKRKNVFDNSLPMIYFVTATHKRPTQIPELTRLSHTLMHVPRIHWIIADDGLVCPKSVHNILRRSGLPYSLIASPKPNMRSFPGGVVPRGVSNRRAALDWIHQFTKDGILYFGDDDNSYDLELFDEIRKTKKLSMFPVGLVGSYLVSSPVVKDGKVVGFFDSWIANRKFPVDMAGFAVNINHLKSTAVMPYEAGFLEDKFLVSNGFEIDDIEPLAGNCTKVLVWHTQSYKTQRRLLQADVNAIGTSKYGSLAKLLGDLSKMGIVRVDPKVGMEGAIWFQGHKIHLRNITR